MNNRELKFRIWDNLKKEWVQNKGLWRIVTNDSGIGEITAPISFKQHPLGHSIQQFTGLLDKNEKEIFEGDIVKHNWIGLDAKIGIVVSHFGEYLVVDKYVFDKDGIFITKHYTGNCWYQTTLKSIFTSQPNHVFEIIGNVFENIKLLK